MFRPRSKSAAPLGTIQKFRRRIALTTLTALALFSLLIGAESAAAAVNATKAAINIQPVCSPAVTVTNAAPQARQAVDQLSRWRARAAA